MWLVAVDDEGDVNPEAVTSREALLSAIPLLEADVGNVEEEGHPDAEACERRTDLLHALRQLARGQ